MRDKKFKFEGHRGYKLSGQLDLPDSEPVTAYCLFAHCFTCSKNFKAAAWISQALARNGFGVLRFDFSGLGESEGDFSETTFSSNVEDLLAAAKWLEKEYSAPKLLAGHSLGGAAVVHAAAGIEHCQAVVTINSPAEPRHVEHLLESKRREIEENGQANVVIAGRTFRIKRKFLEDLESTDLRPVLRGFKKALLVMHAPADQVVSIDHASKLFRAASHPRSFISLPETDHFLANRTDASYAGNLIAAWVSRYLQ